MKTGQDVLHRALILLGYTGIDGAVDGAQAADLLRRGLDVVNQVSAEIWPLERPDAFRSLTSLQEEIPLSVYAIESVLPYGVAMFLAQADGDGTNQQFFASLYQQKRNAAERAPARRMDALPRVWG